MGHLLTYVIFNGVERLIKISLSIIAFILLVFILWLISYKPKSTCKYKICWYGNRISCDETNDYTLLKDGAIKYKSNGNNIIRYGSYTINEIK